jgi:hypothetical protein
MTNQARPTLLAFVEREELRPRHKVLSHRPAREPGLRQYFFEFITGNHKPSLRNVDEAMRRRLHLIPFTVTIPEAERDPLLAEKLKAEWPGEG